MRKYRRFAFLLLMIVSFRSALALPADFTLVKERVVETLMKTPVNDSYIEGLVKGIRPDGTWADINYEDVSNEGFQHSRHSGNMVALARAFQFPTSRYYQSKQVKKTIEQALAHWVEHDYICDNWWHNQIGTPENLVNLMLIVGSELPKELVEKVQPIIGRAHVDAPGARPGGDRIKIAAIQAKNMLFTGDRQTFNELIKIIENEIKQVEWIGREYGYTYRQHNGGFSHDSPAGRGIQYGYSFHHRTDGVNNTLSYGLGYAHAFIEWAVYTAGTEYSFSDHKIEQLVDYFLDGICKTAVYGKYPDAGEKNRDVSRRGSLRPYSAKAAEDLLKTTNYRGDELQEIANLRNNFITRPTVSHATFFWNTEHFTYQRPEWFTSVRMYSTRTHNMEVGYNSEGLLNHHRGDGTNHVSRTGEEYFDIFPVFDYQKVPGATIVQKKELPPPKEIQKLGLTDFVGAVTDGIYGAAAFDFKSPHDPLIARKSWFFFDNEYVCLGTGISSRQPLPVATTLNQTLLRGDVVVSAREHRSVIPKGEKQLEKVDWVFHDSVGYVFTTPSTINLMNDEATGSWWDISKQSSTPRGSVTKEVFKLWIDHGNRPSDAAYEYIVVPATSLDKLQQNISRNSIDVISNTPAIQAVINKSLGICQAVFYKGGALAVTENITLACDHPGIVMLHMDEGEIKRISVSDPNRELTRFHLSLSSRVEGKGAYFQAVWDANERVSRVWIDLPRDNYAGSSVSVEVQ
ncbi:MAG: chondroitin lyase [Bacteroidales bacterium]|nr:chondroitin lyase [Bacteroidales bacterium]